MDTPIYGPDYMQGKIRRMVEGAPFAPGDQVKVVKAADETFDQNYMGKEGVIVDYDYHSGCGQSYPEDPLMGVVFSGMDFQYFWKEELLLIKKSN